MANGFFAAAKASMNAFGGTRRRPGPPIDPSAVGWGDAAIGVAILVGVVAISIVAPGAGIILQFLPQLFDILLVTFLTLAVPFVVLVVAALWVGQREKLPLLVLFTSLSLLLIQVTSFALSFLNMSTSTALIGVTAVFVGRAARTVLGFSIGLSILVGAITAVGIFAASMLLLLLPTGQAMLAGV
jgi:hypothetical protein